ncbi:hypothetical protein Tco_1109213 [Tanacetum coccineum]
MRTSNQIIVEILFESEYPVQDQPQEITMRKSNYGSIARDTHNAVTRMQTVCSELTANNSRVKHGLLKVLFKTNNSLTPIRVGTTPGNTVTTYRRCESITTRSGVTTQGPTIPPTTSTSMNRDTEVTKDTMPPTNNGSTKDVQPPVVQVQSRNQISKPDVESVSAPKVSIPFPSRRNDENRREKANEQIEKFYEIFKDMNFEISFLDALTLMPKFASTLKANRKQREIE